MLETSGTVDFVVGQETFQTWYKVLGDLRSGIRPLILLHGGPGFPHQYLLGHDELYASYSIPVIWYDQVGCGASTHLPDKPSTFWTPELFMDELENLITHLGISDDFSVLGHCWGGMLVAQWAATRQPRGLKSIVLADTPASLALWVEAAGKLLLQVPQDVQDSINKQQDEENYDDPEYQAALEKYYAEFVCRLKPWPEPLSVSFRAMIEDPTVYHTM